MNPFNSNVLAACIAAAALLGCSSPSQGANEAASIKHEARWADEQRLAALRDEFVEISGKDFVEFKRGSAVLGPSAEFRLERQALWLRAYPMISVRLVAGGDGLERVADRRLAMARAQAVQKHLTDVGVQEQQISGIDVAPTTRNSRHRVRTKLDPLSSEFSG